MPRRLLPLWLALLIVAASSTAHAAQGVNLRWSACLSDGGSFNRTFACNTNAGASVMVVSFAVGAPRSQIRGTEAVIDLVVANPVLPNWWKLWNAGACRQSGMTINSTMSPAAVNCLDWSNFQSTPGAVSYTITGAATARIQMASSVAPANVQDLFAGEEYFAFNVCLSNVKTVGTGACAGCSLPVCLKLTSVQLTSSTPANNLTLSTPTNGTDSNQVTWQGPVTSCLAATPTRQGTWGAVKSLYR